MLVGRRRLGLAESDASLRQVVGRDLNAHAISGNNPDKVFAHFAGNMSEHNMPVLQFQPEHRARQDIDHNSFSNNRLFFRHGKIRLLPKVRLKINPSGEQGQSLATFLAPGERRMLQLTDRADARRPKEGGLLGVLGRCRPYPDGCDPRQGRPDRLTSEIPSSRIRNPSERASG